MKVPSKGKTINIEPGVRYVERNHSIGHVFYLEAISEPICKRVIVGGKESLRYSWRAINLETREELEYLITDRCLHYAPTLFKSFEQSERFWFPFGRPKDYDSRKRWIKDTPGDDRFM